MKDYTSKIETSYLTYLDENNLYGRAMSQYIAYGEFKLCDIISDVTKVPDDDTVWKLIPSICKNYMMMPYQPLAPV